MKIVDQIKEKTSNKIVIEIDGKRMESLANEILEEKVKIAKIPGFRQGKAPVSSVRSVYAEKISNDVVSKVIFESIKELELDSKYEGLKGKPKAVIDQRFDVDNPSENFKFSLIYPVAPNVELKDHSKISFDKLKIVVTDEDLNRELEKISKESKFFKKLLDREPRDGDRFKIHLLAKMGKKTIKDVNDKKLFSTLGLDDELSKFFEEKIKNLKAGDTIEFQHMFRNDFPDYRFRGKKVDFKLTVLDIEEPKTFPVGDELAKELEFDSVEDFRKKVKQRMEVNYEKTAYLFQKRSLLDALSEEYKDLEVDENVINREYENIWYQVEQAIKEEESEGKTEKPEKTEEELKEECKKLAERRVRLGLLISKISREKRITVGNEDIRLAIMEKAVNSNFMPQVMEFYKNPRVIEQLRSGILEEKVVQYLLNEIQGTDVEVDFDGLRDKVKEMLPGFSEEELNEAIEQMKNSLPVTMEYLRRYTKHLSGQDEDLEEIVSKDEEVILSKGGGLADEIFDSYEDEDQDQDEEVDGDSVDIQYVENSEDDSKNLNNDNKKDEDSEEK